MFVIKKQNGVIYSRYEVNRAELREGEVEVTQEQFKKIKPPCTEKDGQYDPCNPIVAGETDEVNCNIPIETLKSQLTETDYKIIKCTEYQLMGMDLPYDIAALHAQRQEIRDQINELETA